MKDKKTGLIWARDANIADREMTWDGALKFIEKLNEQKVCWIQLDWKLPAKKMSLAPFWAVQQKKTEG